MLSHGEWEGFSLRLAHYQAVGILSVSHADETAPFKQIALSGGWGLVCLTAVRGRELLFKSTICNISFRV